MSEPEAKEKSSFIEMLGKHPGKFALGGSVAVVLVWGFYLWQFRFGLSDSQETWGQFGDFVGGTLNSVFGFLGFLILLSSLRQQARELEETRKELKAASKAQKKQAKHFRREAKKKDHTDAISFIIERRLIHSNGTEVEVEITPNGPRIPHNIPFDCINRSDYQHNYKIIGETELSRQISLIISLDYHCFRLKKKFKNSPALIKPIDEIEACALKFEEKGWITDLKFFGKHGLPYKPRT